MFSAKRSQTTLALAALTTGRPKKRQQVDPSHTLNVLLTYTLPFGKGQHWTSSNRIGQGLTSGWKVAGIVTYRSGPLFGTIAASCNLPNAGGCYADYNPAFSGDVRINGNYGSGDVRTATYVNKSAFANPAAFNYGTTPRTGAFGLRGPSNSNTSMSLKREFSIHERWKVTLQADALNMFNWVKIREPEPEHHVGQFRANYRHRQLAARCAIERTLQFLTLSSRKGARLPTAVRARGLFMPLALDQR